jgi:hypothetical protein
MSVAVQYYQPLPLSGGVRFPHGGLVLIAKGQVDRYVPPRYGGGTPSLRRNLEASRKKSLRKGYDMDQYSFPPWKPSNDDIRSSDSARFSECEKVIETFCSRINGDVTEQTYSISEQWGAIVRAKIAFETDGSPGTALLTCWSASGPDVRFDLTLDCRGCGER